MAGEDVAVVVGDEVEEPGDKEDEVVEVDGEEEEEEEGVEVVGEEVGGIKEDTADTEITEDTVGTEGSEDGTSISFHSLSFAGFCCCFCFLATLDVVFHMTSTVRLVFMDEKLMDGCQYWVENLKLLSVLIVPPPLTIVISVFKVKVALST